ncbi:MAG: VCBS repeat-containing protein [Planctomycetes bacterium]|nr:VCBS repeat-containing protein [Planctomycetota bacterium]
MNHPSLRVILAVATSIGGSQLIAQKKLYEYRSNGLNDIFGYSVAGLGDVDLDGRPDFAIGNFYDDRVARDAGAVSVYSGMTGILIRTHRGDGAGDWAGHAVATAGDFDRDGAQDVLVGAYGSDKAFWNGGLVRCYSGKSGALLQEVTADRASEEFGIALQTLGDVDSDGVPDWLVGARRGDSTPGAVVVVSAKTGKRLYEVPWHPGISATSYGSISIVGDVDGDQTPDFVVGSRAEGWGAVRLYSGRGGKVLLQVLGTSSSSANFGDRVAGIGDVDRDGAPDFAFSTIDQQSTSQPRLFTIRAVSSKSGKELWAIRKLWEPLASLTSVGDMSGDGFPDVLYGLSRSVSNNGAGSVTCLNGATGQELFVIDGPERSSSFGHALDDVGDVNGDGVQDFLVGMAQWKPGGAAQVWSGTPTNVRGGYTFFGQPCRDSTGVLWSMSPSDTTVPHVRGSAIKLQVNAPAFTVAPSAAIWIVGTRNDTWGSIPLPVALQAPFLPGCSLGVEARLPFALAIPNPNAIALTIPIPQSPSLIGLDVFIQTALYATWQSGTRTIFGLHMTDSVQAKIGS